MKVENKNYSEFVQRIQERYVSDDCIQIMIPQTKSTLTILSDGG